MKSKVALLTLAALLMLLAGPAMATPAIDSAVITARVFNDNPSSVVTTVNNYPSTVMIQDVWASGAGYANLHNFRLSASGGATAAVFNNGDAFRFSSDVTVTGTGEGGLNVAPWWNQDVDGRFMLSNATSEIVAFGGRLPFYSFTTSQGLYYVAGQPVRLGIIYDPHSLNAGDPATIEYLLTMGGTNYTSGPLPFDMGVAAEDPPYGLWGMLNDARVGGYLQAFVGGGPGDASATFTNMSFVPEPATLSLLALGGLALIRRRKP